MLAPRNQLFVHNIKMTIKFKNILTKILISNIPLLGDQLRKKNMKLRRNIYKKLSENKSYRVRLNSWIAKNQSHFDIIIIKTCE